jgi:hypothetical protein
VDGRAEEVQEKISTKYKSFKDGGLGRRYKEQYDAQSKETPFEAENQHAPRARSFVEARAGEVSALSRNEAAASGLPALRLLQRQSCEGSFGLGFVKQDDGVKPPATSSHLPDRERQ